MSVIFVTVHGTGDQTTDAAEPKWWEPKSEFSQQLLDEAGGGKVRPFMWDGKNDEISRRDAAQELNWRLREYEDRGDQVVLIGHSHGGSVIATALKLASADERDFSNIKSVITIGTPYIGMKKQNQIWERLGLFGQLAWLYSIFLTISVIFTVLTIFAIIFSQSELMTQMASSGLPTGETYADRELIEMEVAEAFSERNSSISSVAFSITLIAAIFFFIRKSQERVRALYSKKGNAAFLKNFNSRWLALYDVRDEAINGLTRVYAMKLNILNADQLNGFVRMILVVGAALFVGSTIIAEEFLRALDYARTYIDPTLPIVNNMMLDGILNNVVDPDNIFGQFRYGVDDFAELRALDIALFININTPFYIETTVNSMNLSSFGFRFLANAIAASINFTIILLAFPVADIFNKLFFGRTISAGLNGVFGNQIRRQALGNTTKGEDLTGVSKLPPHWPGEAQAFDETASVALCNYAADNARDTLINIQDVIADSMIKSDQTLVDALTEQLSWRELIHTAYFKVPESRNYIIGQTLQKSGLLSK